MINPNKKLTTNLAQILLFLIYLTYTLPTSVSSSFFFKKKNLHQVLIQIKYIWRMKLILKEKVMLQCKHIELCINFS